MVSEYRRRQMARNREVIEIRVEEDAANAQERKRYMATTHRTSYGDRVPKWPDTEPLWARIERLDQALRDLYDEAAQRAETDKTMSKAATTATAQRFPVMGGQ